MTGGEEHAQVKRDAHSNDYCFLVVLPVRPGCGRTSREFSGRTGKTRPWCDGSPVSGNCEVPGAGELIGGSQREEKLDVLLARMKELGVEEESIEWYVNLRRYGGCIHSGFGMGFERLIMYLTGIENIRDVIPYPRTPGSCEF